MLKFENQTKITFCSCSMMKWTRGERAIFGMQIQASGSTDRFPLANQSREKVTFEKSNKCKIGWCVLTINSFSLCFTKLARFGCYIRDLNVDYNPSYFTLLKHLQKKN